MGRGWMGLGASFCAAGVAAGAFGAHALSGRLAPEALSWWELAGRYLLYGGFSLILVGLVAYQRGHRRFDGSGLCLAAGSLIFGGSLGAMALGAPRWLGAVTPVGGSLVLLGFVLFAVQAFRS